MWDAIKSVGPQYADLKHEITNTGGDDQEYELQHGDMLSKLSEIFYGSASHYMKIAQASGMADPNQGMVGQKITIPPLD